jgi:peptide/nickel transport system substrate-binding protein
MKGGLTMLKKTILRSFLLLMVGMCLVLFSTLTEAETLAEKQVLRIGKSAGDLGNLDPHRAVPGQDRNIADMLFNGLICFKPGNVLEFEPDLAKGLPKSEIIDGKQVWTFQLREGVMVHPFPGYQNGYELTAEDVVYSFKKAANKDLSAFSSPYRSMSFVALDKFKVKITLEKPLSSALFFPLIADFMGGFIVPQKAFEALGADTFKTHPVGTGPFRFKKYEPGTQLILVANERYFRGAPTIKRVEYKYMREQSSREMALETGELDIAELTREEASIKPLDSLKVRQAICYALDQADYLKYYGKIAAPIYSQVPFGFMPGGLSKKDVADAGLDYILKKDIQKAKKLLAEAGYPKGFSLKVVSSGHKNYLPVFEIAQQQLKKVGIDLKIEGVEHKTYHSMIRKNVNPLVVYTAPRPNADTYLSGFFHSDSIVVTGKKPVTNFANFAGADDLIEKAKYETDSKKQVQLWKEAQLRILKHAAGYSPHLLQYAFAVKDYVDLGYDFKSTLAQYPQVTELTRILKR